MEERHGKLNVRYHKCDDGPEHVITDDADPKIFVFKLPFLRGGVAWQMNVGETCFEVKYCPWCGRTLATLVEESSN